MAASLSDDTGGERSDDSAASWTAPLRTHVNVCPLVLARSSIDSPQRYATSTSRKKQKEELIGAIEWAGQVQATFPALESFVDEVVAIASRLLMNHAALKKSTGRLKYLDLQEYPFQKVCIAIELLGKQVALRQGEQTTKPMASASESPTDRARASAPVVPRAVSSAPPALGAFAAEARTAEYKRDSKFDNGSRWGVARGAGPSRTAATLALLQDIGSKFPGRVEGVDFLLIDVGDLQYIRFEMSVAPSLATVLTYLPDQEIAFHRETVGILSCYWTAEANLPVSRE